jgi:hypothetical protein
VAHALKKLRSATVVSAVPPSQLAALSSSSKSDPFIFPSGAGHGGDSEQKSDSLRKQALF